MLRGEDLLDITSAERQDALLRSLFGLKHFGPSLEKILAELESENHTRAEADFSETRCGPDEEEEESKGRGGTLKSVGAMLQLSRQNIVHGHHSFFVVQVYDALAGFGQYMLKVPSRIYLSILGDEDEGHLGVGFGGVGGIRSGGTARRGRWRGGFGARGGYHHVPGEDVHSSPLLHNFKVDIKCSYGPAYSAGRGAARGRPLRGVGRVFERRRSYSGGPIGARPPQRRSSVGRLPRGKEGIGYL